MMKNAEFTRAYMRGSTMVAAVLLANGCASLDVGEDRQRLREEQLQGGEAQRDASASSDVISDDADEVNAEPKGPALRGASCSNLLGAAQEAASATKSNATKSNGERWLEPLQREHFSGEYFDQLWGSGDSDIWAIGQRDPKSHELQAREALECVATRHDANLTARHFDGTSWQSVDFPGNSRVYDLQGSSATNVWAVGAQSRAWHFDGQQWTGYDLSDAVGTPLASEPCSEVVLTSVWVLSDVNVWSVGYVNSGGTVSPLLLHFDGDRWLRQEVTGDEPLLGVWGPDAEHAWAVGARGAVHAFLDDHWQRAPIMTDNDLTAVSGASAENVWIAGNGATMLRFDGGTWQTKETAVDYTTSEAMVAHDDAGLWMLSDTIEFNGSELQYVQTLDHWDGGSWCSVHGSSDVEQMFAEVWVSPTKQVWASGYELARFL
jgi:hypothetical protein